MLNFQPRKSPEVSTKYLVLGAGVAGIHIAEHLASKGGEVWLLGSPYESQLAKAGIIEDSELIPEGTVGLKFIEEIYERAKNAGVKTKTSMVTEVDMKTSPMKVITKFQDFNAENLIITTGAHQQKARFEGEEQFYRKGISDCAVCDGNLFRGRVMGVYGSHKYTVKSANYLSKIGSKIHLFWTEDAIPQELLERLDDSIVLHSGVTNFRAYGNENLERVAFSSLGKNGEIELSVLFVEGKPEPESGLFALDKNDDGSIQIDENFRTSRAGVLAVGDVTGVQRGYDDIMMQVEKFKDMY